MAKAGPITRAVYAEIRSLHPDVKGSTDAEIAKQLARHLDGCSATQAAPIAKQLDVALTHLRNRSGELQAAKDRSKINDILNRKRRPDTPD